MRIIAVTTREAEGKQIMKILRIFAFVVLLCAPGLAPSGQAQSLEVQARKDEQKDAPHRVRPLLRQLFPQLELISLGDSTLPGLMEAQLSEGVSVYLSPDGRNVLVGELYSVSGEGIIHVSEQGRMRWRKQLLDEVRDSAIVFSPRNRKPRASLTVFTDVDCGYCRTIHQDVPTLNRRGIEVRYLAFPRGGVDSETYRKMVSAWCSADQQRTLTRLKRGVRTPIRLCAGNPVAEHYRLGQRLGIRGTPALLTDDGAMAPGYRPPDQIQRLLGLE